MDYDLIRVFNNDDGAQGNQSAVVTLKKKITGVDELSHIATNIYKEKSVATSCFIINEDNEQFEVRCFNRDSEIQCCGHGLIAAAKVIFSRSKLINIVLNRNIAAVNKDDEIELSLPRISAKVCETADWANKAMTYGGECLLPNQTAISEKLDGYLLFEFNPNLSLDVFSELLLDLNTVCESTKRAIVIIQFDEENRHLYTRYFAPQYGVKEDSATGSVMRFVGDYIMQTYNIAEYQVNQCSKEGGYMKIKCREKDVLITANATIESF